VRRIGAGHPTVAAAVRDYDAVREARAAHTAPAHGTACVEEAGLDVRMAAVRADPAAVGALAEADLRALATERGVPPARWLAVEVLAAVAQLRTNDLEGCLPRLVNAERRCRELRLEHLLLLTLSELARGLSQSGEPLRAIELLQEAVELARVRGDLRAEAQNLCNLGFVFGDRDDPQQYAHYTREALALHAAFEDPYGRAMAHCNLGGALSRLRRLDEAEANYRTARALAERYGMRFVQALCLGGEGGVYCERGDWENGRASYAASNAVLAELGNRYQICRHHYLLGQYFLRADLLDDATSLLSEAADEGRAGGFGTTLAMALESLSTVCERQGDPARALVYLREHLATQKRVVETAMEDRVRAAERRAQAESARREAEFERRRSDELHQVNDELRAALARQRELQAELLRVSQTDPLTRLSNRRHMRELLDREVHRLTRRFRPMSLLLIDVDHFKKVNDLYGHDVGDEVLVELATRLRSAVRAIDPVGRWGGEEFCVAVFETDVGAAIIPAEHVRARIAQAPFRTRVGDLSLTVSVGVAALAQHSLDVDEALRRADQALYKAKARGRNCVVAAA
jgi:diguanylate cyclase (GGDEF)-like protein